MRAILMTSVAMAALAAPAFAGPDRYDQGLGCDSMSNAMCVQQQLKLDDGNRIGERTNETATGVNGAGGTTTGATLSASRPSDTGNDETFGGEVGGSIAHAEDEAGDTISNTADEAGDAISNAADEAGDAIGDAFN